MNAPVAIARTPSGRTPGSPLRNRKHEIVARELACGRTQNEAVKTSGAVDPAGSSFASNARRLCQRPEIRERVEEIAAQEAEMVGIYAGWLLADVKLYAESSLSRFFQYDSDGKIVVDAGGDPVIDFTGVSKSDLRMLRKMRPGKYGTEYEVHDPHPYIDKLGRYLGLWASDTAVAISNADAHYIISDKPMSEDEWERTRAQPTEQHHE